MRVSYTIERILLSLTEVRHSRIIRAQRMGKAAGIIGVRCSPHTLRHTFAIQFLRNGGNSFALQGLLGHTDMKQTAGYVRIANLNLAEQHVLASPMDNLRRK